MQLCRVIRVHDLPWNNCIWFGASGAGKSTILQLASKVTGADLLQLPKKTNAQETAKFIFSCIRSCASLKKQLYVHIPYQ